MIVGGKALWLIPFYHLNSWTRTLGPFGAGAIRMPLRVWMPLDYLGAILTNSVWVGAGWILGQAVLTPEGKLDEHPALRIGLGLGAAIWFVLAQREFLKSYRNAMREEEAVVHPRPPRSPPPKRRGRTRGSAARSPRQVWRPWCREE